MKYILRLIPFLVFTSLQCKAQYKKPTDFIPDNYTEFETVYGDLNKDGIDDCVLIIKKVDSSNIVLNEYNNLVDRNRRGIIILFKEDDRYQLIEKNYSCFSSDQEYGGIYYPPELYIEIQKGNLYVKYSHGRYGAWKYTFRYQNSNFTLIGYDNSSNYGPVVNTQTSINFLTKKKLIRENTNENDEGGDEVFKDTWSKVTITELIKLAEIIDFDELSMRDY